MILEKAGRCLYTTGLTSTITSRCHPPLRKTDTILEHIKIIATKLLIGDMHSEKSYCCLTRNSEHNFHKLWALLIPLKWMAKVHVQSLIAGMAAPVRFVKKMVNYISLNK